MIYFLLNGISLNNLVKLFSKVSYKNLYTFEDVPVEMEQVM